LLRCMLVAAFAAEGKWVLWVLLDGDHPRCRQSDLLRPGIRDSTAGPLRWCRLALLRGRRAGDGYRAECGVPGGPLRRRGGVPGAPREYGADRPRLGSPSGGNDRGLARRSRLVTWLVGGLNFQTEHHLFPRISHVNYPVISTLVEQTCRDCEIRYTEFTSFRAGLASHFRWLRRMGIPNRT
jgi:hypothetical protein